MMSSRRFDFDFDFDPAHQCAARVFGITPENAWVDVGDDRLSTHYGRWRLQTDLANVTGARITGPYCFSKTAGPPRLGITDLGLTFASNGRRGVLISFRHRVPGIDGLGILRHGELTVTVADPVGLVRVLTTGSASS